VAEGAYQVEVEGPEYETTNALGPMCWVSDPEAILYANRLCNEYGLDTISTASTVAFALELHERGLISDEPDLSLEWGSPAVVHGLIERNCAAPRHRRYSGGGYAARGLRASAAGRGTLCDAGQGTRAAAAGASLR